MDLRRIMRGKICEYPWRKRLVADHRGHGKRSFVGSREAVVDDVRTGTLAGSIEVEIAVLRGCDVDQPRNLAKSVTVE